MAALCAGAGDATRSALRLAATKLGHAFQLPDDIEDCAKTPATFTKDRNKDAGKSTLVALLGLNVVEQRLTRHLAQAEIEHRDALANDQGVVAALREIFSSGPIARQKSPAPHIYQAL